MGKYYTCQQESLCVFIQEIGYERRYVFINAQRFVIKLKGARLFFRLPSHPTVLLKKQDTDSEARALTTTESSNGKYLISSSCFGNIRYYLPFGD